MENSTRDGISESSIIITMDDVLSVMKENPNVTLLIQRQALLRINREQTEQMKQLKTELANFRKEIPIKDERNQD